MERGPCIEAGVVHCCGLVGSQLADRGRKGAGGGERPAGHRGFDGLGGHSGGWRCVRVSGAQWAAPWAEVGRLLVIGGQAFGEDGLVAFSTYKEAIPGLGGAFRAVSSSRTQKADLYESVELQGGFGLGGSCPVAWGFEPITASSFMFR